MKLTLEEIGTYKDMIASSEYALIKQIDSVTLMSDYGDIPLLESEHEKLQTFLIDMMSKRTKKLCKEIKENQ